MWTKEHRQRLAEQQRLARRYPSDLSDAEWAVVEPLLPRQRARGRKRQTDLRDVVDAIRYLVRSGCGWRMLPNDFLPWPTVYWWFRRSVRRFLFRTVHDLALMLGRELGRREASPSAAVPGSQAVKAPGASRRGYDAGKKVNGRKRHIPVDTGGRLLMVRMTPADLSDSAGAQAMLKALKKRWPWVRHPFGDGVDDRTRLLDKAAFLDFTVEVVRRLEGQEGFHVLPRRWVVERSFGWMVRWRRLVADHERRVDVSEAMVYVALGANLLRRTNP